jgi:hypothetical protein
MRALGAFTTTCVLVSALSIGPSARAGADLDVWNGAPASVESAPDQALLEAEAEALARRWAPVFVQHVSDEHPERDRPLPVDFDGDWDATDNWTHLTPDARHQTAVVHGSAILTTTHAYLTYTLFFPRDWQQFLCVPYACHDNDLEVLLVVVERGGQANDSVDRLVLVETKAHRSYLALRGADVARTADRRPLVEVESEGHGMQAVRQGDVPEGDRRVFIPESATPALEATFAAASERYGLLSLRSTLWQRRSPSAEHGRLWVEGESGWLSYSGARQGRSGRPMGASMAGREYPGGVRPPWALRAVGNRGDWFLDPALSTLRRYGSWFPAGRAAGGTYVLNRYLDDLRAECVGPACPSVAATASTVPLSSALLGSMFALGLASLWRRRRDA